MIQPISYPKVTYPDNKKLLQEKLINHLVLMWTGLSLIGIVLTSIRSLNIGWTTRDSIQVVVVIVMLSLALNRHKLSTCFKANILVTVNIVIGIVGAYTLGMLAASVFFFPMGAIIISAIPYKTNLSYDRCGSKPPVETIKT